MKATDLFSAVALAGLGFFVAQTAQADELNGKPAPHADRWEGRVGGGIYDVGVFVPHDFNGGTINAELLAPSPAFLERLGSPRPYLGADIALSSDPVHFFYTGLNWEVRLAGKVYMGFSVGGSVNTDKVIGSRDLGSNVLFHLQASAGLDITENMALQVYLNHFSNAGIANANDGLETAGARLAFRF